MHIENTNKKDTMKEKKCFALPSSGPQPGWWSVPPFEPTSRTLCCTNCLCDLRDKNTHTRKFDNQKTQQCMYVACDCTLTPTVSLPPAEIVSKVAVARIQDHTAIKARWKQESLLPEKLLPVEDIGGGELGDHVGHQLTVRKRKRRKDNLTTSSEQSGQVALIFVPCSSLKQRGGLLKNKAELITLAVSDNNVLELRHDTASTLGHQAKGSVVIGLHKLVLVCKPETDVDSWLTLSGR